MLRQQQDYYRARAPEYDEWFFRTGRHDRGETHRQAWLAEVADVEGALAKAGPAGNVLELACGTGLWTRHLKPSADKLTVVDGSPEMLALCRERVGAFGITFVAADLFNWQPPETYDFIFFGHWLSHVPEGQFDAFWQRVASALRPGGKVFFVDSLFTQSSTASDHNPIDHSGIVERKLNDNRSFKIVKIFHEPTVLQARLTQIGWHATVQPTGLFFFYGEAKRSQE
jgi:demethylmenaquinone methyltransferase/2-methoxy-6-polyprenyl-1,4-benzoquinol methylase